MSSSRVARIQRLKLGGVQQRRTSLVQVVLVALLVASLLPLGLIGTLTYIRSRAMLRGQFAHQMENAVTKNLEQVRQYIQLREEMMDRLARDPLFQSNLNVLVNAEPGSTEFQNARSAIFVQLTIFFNYRDWAQTGTTGFFDELMILRPDGELLVESTSSWVLQNFGRTRIRDPFILGLIGSNRSVMTYNAIPNISPNQVAVYTARALTSPQGEPVAAMIATGSNAALYRAVDDTRDFFPGARAYYFTPHLGLIAPDDATDRQRMVEIPAETGLHGSLAPLVQLGNEEAFFGAATRDRRAVQAYARWMPEYQMGLVLELPNTLVYSQLQFLDPLNIAMFTLSLLISGTLIYLGTTRLVNPLVQLARAAERFSKGSWDERARIERSDEIGLLANAFDRMADDLSDLYRSMESAVEKRTSQLRTAADVAQLATSSTGIRETLARTVRLVSERFGYYHVAIYLVDETGHGLALTEAAGVAAGELTQRGVRVEMAGHSLVGWVAVNNRSRVITGVHSDELYRPEALLPDARAEVAIPLSSGGVVMGVLDVQSSHPDAFDADTVTVLQTLANQVAGSLHSTRLLETTQVSYQETNLLYQAARRVAQARAEDEVLNILAGVLAQLPYTTLALDVQDGAFRIRMVADPKSRSVERSPATPEIPAGGALHSLLENRAGLYESGRPSEFDPILSLLYRRGCRKAALLSVVVNGQLAKVLALGSTESEGLTRAGLQPFANLAEVIGTTLEKLDILNALQQRLTELQILTNVSHAMSAENEVSNLFRVLHEQIIQVKGPDLNFAVALYNSKLNQIEFPYLYENHALLPPIEPFVMGQGLTSHILKERKPLMLNRDTERISAALGAKLVGQPARSWLGIPLIFANEVVGALILQDLERENFFTTADLNLFVSLAPHVATAIRNTQLLNETQEALKAYHLEHFLLNSLLANTPDVMAFKDLDGRYIRASRSLADTYGVDIEALAGKTDFDFFDAAAASRLAERQKTVLETGRVETEVFSQWVEPSGEEVWWQFSSIPMYQADDSPYGLLVIQRNITGIKSAEALAERRADQVLIAAEIARDTTGTLDVQALQHKSVNLVRERFGFYHASIFTLDALGEYAVLRESTGRAGEMMLRVGHRLPVGSKSIVGQVAARGKAMVVNDVTADPNYYPNPLLPETRSELAIPLKVGDRILGALDVQSQEPGAFHDDDVSVLQILADQMAVALVNAELFARTQDLLGKHRLLRQVTISAGASPTLEEALVNVVKGLRAVMVEHRVAVMLLNEEGALKTQASAGYEGTSHLELSVWLGEGITGLAAAEKRPVRVDNTLLEPRFIATDPDVRSELAVPILYGGDVIGVLNLESSRVSAFDENDEEILGALGNNLGGVVANIRLLQQVRRQVEREQMLFEITSKIRRSVDLETILQTSAREICRALGAQRASIRITAGESQAGRPAGASPAAMNGTLPDLPSPLVDKPGSEQDTRPRKNGTSTSEVKP